MSVEKNKQTYFALMEAINAKNIAAGERFVAPDTVNHTPVPGEPPGIEGFRYRMGKFIEAFPDFTFITEAIVAEGDLLSTRGVLSGTNTGPYLGRPPTGKRIEVRYMDFVRFKNGKMTEHWSTLDGVTLLQQLGLLPAGAGAPTG